MRAQIAAAAAFVGAAVAAPAEYQYGSSPVAVVYETDVKTITSCAPEVTDCPARTAPAYTSPPSYQTPSAPVYQSPSSTPVYQAPSSTPVYQSAPVYSSSTPCSTATPYYSTPVAAYSSVTPYSSSPAPYYTPAPSAPVTYVACSSEEVTVTNGYSTSVYTSIIPYTTTVCPYSEATTLESYWTPYAAVYSTPVVYSSPVGATTPCTTGTGATYTAPYASGASVTGGVYTSPAAPYPSGTGSGSYGTGSGAVYPTGTGVPTKASPYPSVFTGAASNVNALGGLAGLGAIAALFL